MDQRQETERDGERMEERGQRGMGRERKTDKERTDSREYSDVSPSKNRPMKKNVGHLKLLKKALHVR